MSFMKGADVFFGWFKNFDLPWILVRFKKKVKNWKITFWTGIREFDQWCVAKISDSKSWLGKRVHDEEWRHVKTNCRDKKGSVSHKDYAGYMLYTRLCWIYVVYIITCTNLFSTWTRYLGLTSCGVAVFSFIMLRVFMRHSRLRFVFSCGNLGCAFIVVRTL